MQFASEHDVISTNRRQIQCFPDKRKSTKKSNNYSLSGFETTNIYAKYIIRLKKKVTYVRVEINKNFFEGK